ncbi:MAG TPA: hypothetical protein VFK50_03960 [Sphingomicrobium sp.]|nr:hypothetical protein [Sphingomicrobium sp.]
MSRQGIGLLALALAAGPVAAQSVPPPAPATSIAATPAVVGQQLNDFNLNGTVTRQAAPKPQPVQPSASTARPARQAERPVPSDSAPRAPAPATTTAVANRSPTVAPPPTGSALPSQAPQQSADPAPTPVAVLPMTSLPGEAAPDSLPWPWLFAALAAAGAGLFLFRRHHQQQQRYGAAMAGDTLAFDAGVQPGAAAEPLQRAPVASPPPRPAPTGIVSTRLHPDLDIDLLPERAIVDDQGATIEFQVAVRNHGSAPARDVHVEACMVNAGPAQDQELGAFFAHPGNAGQPIPQIMPMTEIMLKSAVRLKLDQMRQFEVGGRKLFVPLVGVNAVYRGPAGPAQTSASYLVGRDGQGEKMAPFRLDLGPRIFRGLGARQHTLGLRK